MIYEGSYYSKYNIYISLFKVFGLFIGDQGYLSSKKKKNIFLDYQKFLFNTKH
jgi:hypothetical protein